MRNRLAALTLVFLTALLHGQVVEESLSRDPGPLDFIRGDGYEQAILQSLAGDALVGLSPEGRVVARLASSWRVQKDGGLAFALRADARFPDGSPVTPEDALWTFRELLRDPQASPTKRAILAGAQVELREGRLWIRSPRPAGRLLLELARIPVAQKDHPDRGSGPFLHRREPGAWTFSRRDHFLKPAVDGIRFRVLADPTAVLQALQKGWLTLGAPPPRFQGALPPTHRLVTQPMHAQLVVWSRRGAGPLHALEQWRKDAFPPHLLGQVARPSRGLWPETLGFEPEPIHGPAPARTPASLRLLYPAGEELVEKLLLALRERARRDGTDLVLQPLEPGLLVARLQQGDFDLACSTVVFDPHPWAVMEYLEPKGPMNFTGWEHPRLAQLAARLQQPDDPAWAELQALWAEAPAALPLVDLRSAIWVDKRLSVTPSSQGLYFHTPGAAGWRWAK